MTSLTERAVRKPGTGYSDAVAAAALTVLRRALIEGVPVTRTGFEHEAAFTLGATTPDAMAEVDAVAQRLGVSSLV